MVASLWHKDDALGTAVAVGYMARSGEGLADGLGVRGSPASGKFGLSSSSADVHFNGGTVLTVRPATRGMASIWDDDEVDDVDRNVRLPLPSLQL